MDEQKRLVDQDILIEFIQSLTAIMKRIDQTMAREAVFAEKIAAFTAKIDQIETKIDTIAQNTAIVEVVQ